MRLKEEQIRRLAERVYANLAKEGLIVPCHEHAAAVNGIIKVIMHDVSREQALERDAEKLLDESIAAMGRAGAEIDRRRMLKMVKDKLAKERKIVL